MIHNPAIGNLVVKIVVHDILTNKETPLDDHAAIRFGEGEARITVSVRDGVVEISGAGPLTLMPHVSNVVTVTSSRH